VVLLAARHSRLGPARASVDVMRSKALYDERTGTVD
jgi:hypothetical protein